MAGSGFEFDISEMEKISEAFAKVDRINFKTLLGSIGVTEETEIKNRFGDKKDPEGNKWKSWSASYQASLSKRKEGESSSILMGPTAGLRNSINFEVKSYGVIWGSALIYARVHQEGFDKKNIPARPYLGIGQSSQELIEGTIEDFLELQSGGLL